jgi:trehalose-phosphatase
VHKKRLSGNLRKEFDSIGQFLRQSLREIQGILFEDKGLILAVHYRNVGPQYFGRIREVLEKALEKRKDRWDIAQGKMVFEIRPRADFNKGKAVQEILKFFPPQGLLPIYFGDDRTDEDAFRVLRGRGITVFVGPDQQTTEAEFYVKDPLEVKGFLRRCEEMLARTSSL